MRSREGGACRCIRNLLGFSNRPGPAERDHRNCEPQHQGDRSSDNSSIRFPHSVSALGHAVVQPGRTKGDALSAAAGNLNTNIRMSDPILLTDEQMREYIVNGYLVLKPSVSPKHPCGDCQETR